jgi:hypothetical protein
LNGAKNFYPARNVSVTFIDPLKTSYVISLFEKMQQSPLASTWRSKGIDCSRDSKKQSKAELCLRVNYDGFGSCQLVLAIYSYTILVFDKYEDILVVRKFI